MSPTPARPPLSPPQDSGDLGCPQLSKDVPDSGICLFQHKIPPRSPPKWDFRDPRGARDPPRGPAVSHQRDFSGRARLQQHPGGLRLFGDAPAAASDFGGAAPGAPQGREWPRWGPHGPAVTRGSASTSCPKAGGLPGGGGGGPGALSPPSGALSPPRCAQPPQPRGSACRDGAMKAVKPGGEGRRPGNQSSLLRRGDPGPAPRTAASPPPPPGRLPGAGRDRPGRGSGLGALVGCVGGSGGCPPAGEGSDFCAVKRPRGCGVWGFVLE